MLEGAEKGTRTFSAEIVLARSRLLQEVAARRFFESSLFPSPRSIAGKRCARDSCS